ncbi:uncharacterized protein LOC117304321 isoform X1 [Asterias rubens]|uniref:uncharacterized protein LOC117304321 isoform X1 n=2 Tax=Asterias rubens TaxID=7604 RepID=UPI0014550153|nr:uncharacterized protein LOC117304321 isoform X1 [Asterias rubens]
MWLTNATGFSLSITCISAFVLLATLWYFNILRKRKNALSKGRVVLFTRFPEPGKTKTRLVAELGEAGASRAQLYMTDHMLNILAEFQKRKTDTAVEVKVAGGNVSQIGHWLDRKGFPPERFSWSMQCDGHLGTKMAQTFDSSFKKGNEIAVIIGSDIPAIDADILDAALDKLHRSDCEMILGPAKDDGYYLVGLRKEVKHKLGDLNSLFEGIEWGTSKVLQQQLDVASHSGIKVELMSQILTDVDTQDDLGEFERAVGVSLTDLKMPVLSVVIPVLNEEANIHAILTCIKENSSWPSYIEVIISDGGSLDCTVECVDQFAEENPEMKISVVQGGAGRGRQLNAGARAATGVNVLFLHADTRLPWAFDRYVLLTLAEPGNVAGAFNFSFDVLHSKEKHSQDKCSWWNRKQLQILERLVRLRCRVSELAYGDQALFMSRKIFDKAGMFPPFLLMEDYAMVKKLQKFGHLRIIQDVSVVTSARRLLKKGIIKTVIINRLMMVGYTIGIDPGTLGRFYYG